MKGQDETSRTEFPYRSTQINPPKKRVEKADAYHSNVPFFVVQLAELPLIHFLQQGSILSISWRVH